MPAEKSDEFGYVRDPLFLLSVALYFINRELIKPNLHHYSPLFHGHFNDSLLVPVILPLYLLFYRWIGLRPDNAPPRFWEIALHVPLWAIFFEWFGPLMLHKGIADPIDSWCFAGSGIISWLVWQRAWLMQKMKQPQRAEASVGALES